MSKFTIYGLIIPKKGQKTTLPKSVEFSQDSDDDKIVPNREEKAQCRYLKKQHQLDKEKALKDDPHCFDYDDVYDQDHAEMDEKENVEKNYEPKYIDSLLRAAAAKKSERERLLEKKVQKEREAEGDTYNDKESFMSNAYMEKLEAREEERKKRALEDMENQGEENYPEFYRHIFDQKVGARLKNTTPVVSKEVGSKRSRRGSSRSDDNDVGKDVLRMRSNERNVGKRKTRDSSSSEKCTDCNKKSKHNNHREESDDDGYKNTREQCRDEESILKRKDNSKNMSHKTKSSHYDRRNHRTGRTSTRRNSMDSSDRERNGQRDNNDSKSYHRRSSPYSSLTGESEKDNSQVNSTLKDKNNERTKVVEPTSQKQNVATPKLAKKNVGTALDLAKTRYLMRKASNYVEPNVRV